jgi:hypothetical protein
MKIRAAIMVVALLLSLAAPLSIHISATNSAPVLVSLDVCDAAGTTLSLNADIPAIQERPIVLVESALSGYVVPPVPDCFSSVLPAREERPPEA